MPTFEALIDLLDRSKKRLALAFAIAILIHLPLTPGMSLLSLAKRLSGVTHASPAAPPAQQVDVELQEALRNEEQHVEQAKAAAAAKASVQIEQPAQVKLAKSEAKPQDTNQPSVAAKPARSSKVKDVGLEGELAEQVVGRPAVTLGLWFSSLRDSSLGQELIGIATCNREWKRFVDQGIDVPKEVDGMLLVGPGLFDASQLTVAVGHGVSSERVHGVVDALVKASGERGRWLLPDVAAARFGGRDRVLMPLQTDLFFITPRKGWEALHRVKSPLHVPSADGRAASLVIVNPNQVLERVGLALPDGISELRLEAFANQDRSVDLKLELLAKSPEAARRDEKAAARQLEDFVGEAWTMTWALGALAGTSSAAAERERAPRLGLALEGETLRGVLHLSTNQTQALMKLLASFQCRKARGAAPAVSAAGTPAEPAPR